VTGPADDRPPPLTQPPPPPPPPPALPPAGWYPDPAGQEAQRWWDGTSWTVHTGMPPLAPAVRARVTTGTGSAELAGWWRRFGAYLLDVIIVDIPGFLIGFAIGYADVATQAPVTSGTHQLSTGAQVALVSTSVLIGLGYPFLFLRYRGQTVGMMAAGVRAVDRSSGAPLTTAQTWRRVLAFFFLVTMWEQLGIIIGFSNVTGPVPAGEVAFRLVAVATLITTALWPLGSSLKQTLQDKAADTIVVRTRP
jgi:uncharacterized RDD family membrane protein YckC